MKLNCQLNRSLLLKLELHSDPCSLCVVRGAVERLAEGVGFSAEGCRSITLAVDEALANIMRHAYGGVPNKPIEMHFRRVQRPTAAGSDTGLEVQLLDHGIKFDRAKVPACKPNELRPGGRGLDLIRQAMDTVEYTRVGRTNRLRLVKYLTGQPGTPSCLKE